MDPWAIFLLVLGPFAVFAVWAVTAQVLGRFDKPEPVRTEPGFVQRHETAIVYVFAAVVSFVIAGPWGIIAAVTLFVLLAFIGALMQTLMEGSESKSRKRKEDTGDTSTLPTPSLPFHRRFAHNLRKAGQEGPRFWG